jgi:hypothetical protein
VSVGTGPLAKLVALIVTFVPAGVLLGVALTRFKTRALTVKAFGLVMVVDPFTVTVLGPAAAVERISTVAVIVPVPLLNCTGPGEFSAAPPTRVPGPKLTVVAPENVVFTGLIVTCTTSPTIPDVGVSVKSGAPIVSVSALMLEYPAPASVTK